MRILAVTLAFLLLAEASLTARPLDGPAIISAFEGNIVVGAYADGLAFRETYAAGGGISYWDPRSSAIGTWSVVNNLFCTFYENMEGACFRIEQIGANCFDFLAAADTQEQALTPHSNPRYTARGYVIGRTQTCPDELQA